MLEKDYAGLVRVFPLDPSSGKWEVFVLSVLGHRSYMGSSQERQKMVMFRLDGEVIGGRLMRPYHQQRYERN